MLVKIKEALHVLLILAAIVALVKATRAMRSLAALAERSHVFIEVGRTSPAGELRY